MTLVVESAQSASSVYSSSLSHTVPAGANLALVVVRQITGETPNATATLGGVAMTVLDTISYPTYRALRLLSLESPPTGTQTLSVSGTSVRGFSIITLSGTGVIQISASSSGYDDDISLAEYTAAIASTPGHLVVFLSGAGQTGGGSLTAFTAGGGGTIQTSIAQDGGGTCIVTEAGASPTVTTGVNPTQTGTYEYGYFILDIAELGDTGTSRSETFTLYDSVGTGLDLPLGTETISLSDTVSVETGSIPAVFVIRLHGLL